MKSPQIRCLSILPLCLRTSESLDGVTEFSEAFGVAFKLSNFSLGPNEENTIQQFKCGTITGTITDHSLISSRIPLCNASSECVSKPQLDLARRFVAIGICRKYLSKSRRVEGAAGDIEIRMVEQIK